MANKCQRCGCEYEMKVVPPQTSEPDAWAVENAAKAAGYCRSVCRVLAGLENEFGRGVEDALEVQQAVAETDALVAQSIAYICEKNMKAFHVRAEVDAMPWPDLLQEKP